MKNLKRIVLLITCLYFVTSASSEVTKEPDWTTKYIKCNIKKEIEKTEPNVTITSDCPEESRCIDNGTNNTAATVCVCPGDFSVNENYKKSDNSSKYCIKRENGNSTKTIVSTSPLPTTSTTKAPDVATSTTTLNPTTKKVIVTTLASTTTTTTTTTTKAPAIIITTPVIVTTHQPSTHATPTDTSEVKRIPAPTPGHFWSGILIPLTVVAAFIGLVFMIRKYDLLDRAYNRIRNRNVPSQRYSEFMGNDFDDDPLLI